MPPSGIVTSRMTAIRRRKLRRRGVNAQWTWIQPFWSISGAVSFIRHAVLRRIGFFASRCSFSRSRRQISSRRRSEENPDPSDCNAHYSGHVFASFCAEVWPVDSDMILVRILTAEIFSKTSVQFLGNLLAGFLPCCCIAFRREDLLSKILR